MFLNKQGVVFLKDIFFIVLICAKLHAFNPESCITFGACSKKESNLLKYGNDSVREARSNLSYFIVFKQICIKYDKLSTN